MVWDELDRDQRKAVTKSVRAGEAMGEPGLAAVAAGFAIRRRKQLLLQAIFAFLLGVVMVVTLASLRPTDPTFWYW